MANVKRSSDVMDDFHKYLSENYSGGSERFFSPTGFLDTFQRSVEVQVDKVRNHVFVSTVDEAVLKLEPIVAGQQGVFDLTAEPGTGKTSVLPFRFPTKKVVVALPTPFDAWSAFQMATGSCRLKIKGLSLGSADSSVVYTDSYMAAKALLSNYLDYDVLIVDECDSSKGVTRFLAEVKTPGKVLVRMSATHGRTSTGPSKSFQVTEVKELPDARNGLKSLATYVGSKHAGRSLVLAPDADSAAEIHKSLPGSKLISSKSKLGDIARAIVNQADQGLYVADDVCARGLNLNLDTIFDCQMVSEHGAWRPITESELHQRLGRVGRNKPGWYYSPGLDCAEQRDSDIDVFRNNVVRAISNVPLSGDNRLFLTLAEANLLMCSAVEPYAEIVTVRARSRSESPEVAIGSPDSDSGRSKSSRRKSSSAIRGTVGTPSWMFYFGSGSSPDKGNRTADSYIVSHKGRKSFVRRSSHSSTDSGGTGVGSGALVYAGGTSTEVAVSSRSRARSLLPVAQGAPYAVARRTGQSSYDPVALPLSPPVMDLNELTYDMDWPALIRDRLTTGGDLPTLVPPGSWRHTSAGGMAGDWLRRLDDLSVRDVEFEESEFELVCRAWNKLVALVWVKQTPGLSAYSNKHRLEFCARYFQSYFLLATAE